jgi:FkbM family methyltransferase
MRHAGLQRLATGPWGAVVCLGISFAKTVRTGQPTHIYRDADGDWIEADRSTVIASPDLYLKQFESVERKAERLWFHHYQPAAGDVVVDAGAGIGEDTIVFSRRVTPTGRVIAIEAHSRVFRCLQKTVRGSGLANVTALLCAVYSSEGEIFISTDELHAANTIVEAAPSGRVSARSLGLLFEELGLQRVDLLKLNIEGAEADALEGLGAGWEAVRNVVISCHDFLAERGGSPKFRTRSRVVALLESRKFRILPAHPDAAEDWARDYVYGVVGV